MPLNNWKAQLRLRSHAAMARQDTNLSAVADTIGIGYATVINMTNPSDESVPRADILMAFCRHLGIDINEIAQHLPETLTNTKTARKRVEDEQRRSA